MTISTISSYVTTADEIIAHYTDVNADRIANTLTEITLQGGYSLADFTADRDAVDAAITGLIGLENAYQLAAGDRDARRAADRGAAFEDAADNRTGRTEQVLGQPDSRRGLVGQQSVGREGCCCVDYLVVALTTNNFDNVENLCAFADCEVADVEFER